LVNKMSIKINYIENVKDVLNTHKSELSSYVDDEHVDDWIETIADIYKYQHRLYLILNNYSPDTPTIKKQKLTKFKNSISNARDALTLMDQSTLFKLMSVYEKNSVKFGEKDKMDFSRLLFILNTLNHTSSELVSGLSKGNRAPFRAVYRQDVLFQKMYEKWKYQKLPLVGGTNSTFIIFCQLIFDLLEVKAGKPKDYFDRLLVQTKIIVK